MALLVQAPRRTQRVGGIKSIAGEFVNEPRLGGPESIEWFGEGCALPSDTRAGCYDETNDDPVELEAGGVETFAAIAAPFAQYAGIKCWLGGDSEGESYTAQAEAALAAGEDRRLEQELWTWAADGTTATADTLAAAIGAAEEAADSDYLGRPVLIMSRTSATLAKAAGILAREDGILVTANGTPVLATGEAPADEVAIVGAVAVYASPVVTSTAPEVLMNTDMAFAQRIYTIGVDCAYRHHVAIDTETP